MREFENDLQTEGGTAVADRTPPIIDREVDRAEQALFGGKQSIPVGLMTDGDKVLAFDTHLGGVAWRLRIEQTSEGETRWEFYGVPEQGKTLDTEVEYTGTTRLQGAS